MYQMPFQESCTLHCHFFPFLFWLLNKFYFLISLRMDQTDSFQVLLFPGLISSQLNEFILSLGLKEAWILAFQVECHLSLPLLSSTLECFIYLTASLISTWKLLHRGGIQFEQRKQKTLDLSCQGIAFPFMQFPFVAYKTFLSKHSEHKCILFRPIVSSFNCYQPM